MKRVMVFLLGFSQVLAAHDVEYAFVYCHNCAGSGYEMGTGGSYERTVEYAADPNAELRWDGIRLKEELLKITRKRREIEHEIGELQKKAKTEFSKDSRRALLVTVEDKVAAAYRRYRETRDPNDIPYRFRNDDANVKALLAELSFTLHRYAPSTEPDGRLKYFGQFAIRAADQAAFEKDQETRDFYISVAKQVVEIILQIIPPSSLVLSTYEVITGRSLITGQELTAFERSLALANVCVLGFAGELKAGVRVTSQIAENPTLRTIIGRTALGTVEVFDATRPGRLHSIPIENAARIVMDDRGVPIAGKMVSDTFRSGAYMTSVNRQGSEVILARVYSKPEAIFSNWFSPVGSRGGPTAKIIDLALDAKIGNAATNTAFFKIPNDVAMHMGVVAARFDQGSGLPRLVGGGRQIYIEGPIPKDWLISKEQAAEHIFKASLTSIK